MPEVVGALPVADTDVEAAADGETELDDEIEALAVGEKDAVAAADGDCEDEGEPANDGETEPDALADTATEDEIDGEACEAESEGVIVDDCVGMLLVGDTDAEAVRDGDAEPEAVPAVAPDVGDGDVDADTAKLTDVLEDGEAEAAAAENEDVAEGLEETEEEAVAEACDADTLSDGVVDVVGILLVGDTDVDAASDDV